MPIVRAPAYRLYVDESGDHTNHSIDMEERRFLGLTGVIINLDYYRESVHPSLETLKRKHFRVNPDEGPIIFHRQEIRDRKGVFGRLSDPVVRQAFNTDLLNYFSSVQYILITVVIDKKHHREKYGEAAQHPYHFCLNVMLERYCGFLKYSRLSGDVLAEARGAKEDKLLKEAYQKLCVEGTFYRHPGFFQQVLTSKEIKLKPKTANIAGTQMADLLALPSKYDILSCRGVTKRHDSNFGQCICDIIQTKYNRRAVKGQVDGYGKVFIG